MSKKGSNEKYAKLSENHAVIEYEISCSSAQLPFGERDYI